MLPAAGSGGCGSLPSEYPPGRVPRQKQGESALYSSGPSGAHKHPRTCFSDGFLREGPTVASKSCRFTLLTAGGSAGCRSLPSEHPPGRVPRQKQAPRGVRARCIAQCPVEVTSTQKKLLHRSISMQKVLKWRLKGAFSPCCRPVAAVVADTCPPCIYRAACRAGSRPRAG